MVKISIFQIYVTCKKSIFACAKAMISKAIDAFNIDNTVTATGFEPTTT